MQCLRNNLLRNPSICRIGSRWLSNYKFDQLADETLESLYDHIDDTLSRNENLKESDATYSNGVLTISLDSKLGTYVLNKQSPNSQIWLSSPTSGPKRYDFIEDRDAWIYKHDDQTLHRLLQTELASILGPNVNFCDCKHSGNK